MTNGAMMFSRDMTTGLTSAEAVALEKSLSLGVSKLKPVVGENTQRFPRVPDFVNNSALELLAKLGSPSYFTKQEIYGISDGTSASESFSFKYGTADTKITTNGQNFDASDGVNRHFPGLVIDATLDGPDNSEKLGVVITGVSRNGAFVINTDMVCAVRGPAYAVVLFHDTIGGQQTLIDAIVGREMDQAQATLAAWAATTDLELTVALTGCLNKTIRVSLLNNSMPDFRDIITKVVAVSAASQKEVV